MSESESHKADENEDVGAEDNEGEEDAPSEDKDDKKLMSILSSPPPWYCTPLTGNLN